LPRRTRILTRKKGLKISNRKARRKLKKSRRNKQWRSNKLIRRKRFGAKERHKTFLPPSSSEIYQSASRRTS
jgi:hypothetical protein